MRSPLGFGRFVGCAAAAGRACAALLVFGVLALPAVAGPPPFEVSKGDREAAAKESERAAKKVRERKYRDAFDRYLSALALDPYNQQARAGLAYLIGPIGQTPQAATGAEAPVGSGAAGSRSVLINDPDAAEARSYLGTIRGGPTGKLKPTGPHYLKAKPYLDDVKRCAEKYNVDPRLILAVIKTESDFNPMARSSSGARGLMQLLPATAARFGAHSLEDPAENIEAGTQYLRYLLDLFKNDVDKALAGYNAGEMTVVKTGGVPARPDILQFLRDVHGYYMQF
jgi:soluble lytic murein transglycosylase-like protein